jgi:hypothetical protein
MAVNLRILWTLDPEAEFSALHGKLELFFLNLSSLSILYRDSVCQLGRAQQAVVGHQGAAGQASSL